MGGGSTVRWYSSNSSIFLALLFVVATCPSGPVFVSALPNVVPVLPAIPVVSSLSIGGEGLKQIVDQFSAGLPSDVKFPSSVEELVASFPGFDQFTDRLGEVDLEGLQKLFGSRAARMDALAVNEITGKLTEAFDGALTKGAEGMTEISVKDWSEALVLAQELGGNLDSLASNGLLPFANGGGSLPFQEALSRASGTTELLSLDISELQEFLADGSGFGQHNTEVLDDLVSRIRVNIVELGDALMAADVAKDLPGMDFGGVTGLGGLTNPFQELDLANLAAAFSGLGVDGPFLGEVQIPGLLSASAHDSLESFDDIDWSLMTGQEAVGGGSDVVAEAAQKFSESFTDFMAVRGVGSENRDVAATLDALQETASSYKDWFVTLKNLLRPMVDGVNGTIWEMKNSSGFVDAIEEFKLAKDLLVNATQILKFNDSSAENLMLDSLMEHVDLAKGDDSLWGSVVWHDLLFQLGMQKSVESAIAEDVRAMTASAAVLEAAMEKLAELTEELEEAVGSSEGVGEVVSGDVVEMGLTMLTTAVDEALEAAEGFLQSTAVLEDWKKELGMELLSIKNNSLVAKLDILDVKSNLTEMLDMSEWNFTQWWEEKSELLEDLVGDENVTLWDLLESKNETLLEILDLKNDSLWNFLDLKNASVSDLLEDKNLTLFELLELKNATVIEFVDFKNGTLSEMLEEAKSALNISEVISSLESLLSHIKSTVPVTTRSSDGNVLEVVGLDAEMVSSLRGQVEGVVARVQGISDVAEMDTVEAVLSSAGPSVRRVFRAAMQTAELPLAPASALLSASNLDGEMAEDVAEGLQTVIRGVAPDVLGLEGLPSFMGGESTPEFFDLLEVNALMEAADAFKLSLAPLHRLNLTGPLGMGEIGSGALDVLKEEGLEHVVAHVSEAGEELLSEFERFHDLAEMLGVPVPPSFFGAVNITQTIVASVDGRGGFPQFDIDVNFDADVIKERDTERSAASGEGPVSEILGLVGSSRPLGPLPALPQIGSGVGGSHLGRLRGILPGVVEGVHNLRNSLPNPDY